MPGIGNTFYNLIDMYKSQDPNGQQAAVIEMLMENNPMLEDAVAVECNNGSTHMHTVRTGLPAVAWGRLYKGIPQSKSTKAQVQDTTGFVEGLSTVDMRLLKLSGNEGAIRLSEANGFMEAMEQEVANKIIYGNSNSNPDQFMGLAPRFNDPTAPNGSQIVDGGGDADANTSVWMIAWGENRTHLLYPKNTQAGITREDKGPQRVQDEDGNPYYVKEELFTHHVGLAVADWRYVVRIANIDIDALRADPSDLNADHDSIYDLFRRAYWKLHSRRPVKLQSGGMGRVSVYANKDVLEALDALSTNSGSADSFVRLVPQQIEGKEILTYRSMPLRETDALLNTEETIAFA